MKKKYLFKGLVNAEMPAYSPTQLKAVRKAKGQDQIQFKVTLNEDKVKGLCKAMGFEYTDKEKAIKKLVGRIRY